MKFFQFLIPQSLRVRLILLVLGTLLAAQAATLYLVSLYQRDHVQTAALNLIATTIRTLQYSIDGLAPGDRAEFVRLASHGQWRLWSRALPDDARLQRRPQRRDGTQDPRPPPRDVNDPARRGQNNQWGPGPGPRAGQGLEPGPGGNGSGTVGAGPGTGVATGVRPAIGPGPGNGPGPGPGMRDEPPREQLPVVEYSPDDLRFGLRLLVNELNVLLGHDARVALSRGPKPEIFISLARSERSGEIGPREWLVIPIDRIDPPLSTALLAWWAAGLGLVLLIAVWFSLHISRPITRLVEATDQLAAGNPERVSPAGPTETRRLGERFNAMIDKLAESESTRRTLLAGLPHDLKGPLSRMWLRVEMTDDTALKDGMRNDLQDMQHIVDQFIGFLRGTDLATYHFAPLALNDWIVERIDNWKGAGSEVVLVGKPVPAIVNADSLALARLLDNLISNALHHGATPIHVTLGVQDQWAVLRVSDHGTGIPAERRLEALKPFVRLDEARTRTGNVGLGLALCEAIVRAHAGSLSLGQGSEGGLQVEVRLPLHYPTNQAPD